MTLENVRVDKCGIFYIPHLRSSELRIEGSNFIFKIPLGQLESDDIEKIFLIFDLDKEDGHFIDEIEGKLCRLVSESEHPHRRTGLMHILNDKVFWIIK